MSDQLHDLLRAEAGRIDLSPPPTRAILTDGRRRHRVRRTQALVAVAASVALVAGGLVGISQLGSDQQPGPAPDPADTPSSTPSTSTTEPAGQVRPLGASGSGIGGQAFGTDREEVLAALTADLGRPDLTVPPQRYYRLERGDLYTESADDPLSATWRYPAMSVSCWQVLCLTFGGADVDALQLRGWELGQYRRWSGEEIRELTVPDVRLAGSGLGLGDSWRKLHAAYPGTVVAGGEGASVTVRDTPWAGWSDGVGEWRLSGLWDYTHAERAPRGAVVTRLSAGEGPEPGCC